MIQKLLIANRGEIANRIIRTCQQMGIATVAVFSEADRHALHTEQADEAIYIGASAASESYLNIEKIIHAARLSGADAIHPGYGFLAENATFARAVLEAGFIWIGPQADVIEAMGNKSTAKQILHGVPYVPGYTDEDQSDETLVAEASRIGYPIMIKAAAGGGGKGMRLVTTSKAILDALGAARREAQQAFGNKRLMLEKALTKARHIEVQIIGDQSGHVIALGERECSIQRRHQKIVEESPAFGLDPKVRKALHETAVQIGEQLQYVNAGTVEFLLDDANQFYFMEMNTRLQVEHPVTEMVYGIDLVRWQIEIAEGTTLSNLVDRLDHRLEAKGHAIEVRIYAEDPTNGFLPTAGTLLNWHAPEGIRVDSGVRTGDTISTHYDPMLAKAIAHGANRDDAIRKLDYALSRLGILGIRNNAVFLRRVLTHPDHVTGRITTDFLDTHTDLIASNHLLSPAALIAATIAKQGIAQKRWRNNPNRPISHHFQFHENIQEVHLTPQSNGAYLVRIHDTEYAIFVQGNKSHEYQIQIDNHLQKMCVFESANNVWWVQTRTDIFELTWLSPLPLPHTRTEAQGSLRSPMPGQVVAIHTEVGKQVSKGDLLIILEAMKMEHRIEAPYDGIVEVLRYHVGDSVQQDEVLIELSENGSRS